MSIAIKAKRAISPRRAAPPTFPQKPSSKPPRLSLEELLRHPAFGMWKDKAATVQEEVRHWRNSRYGLG